VCPDFISSHGNSILPHASQPDKYGYGRPAKPVRDSLGGRDCRSVASAPRGRRRLPRRFRMPTAATGVDATSRMTPSLWVLRRICHGHPRSRVHEGFSGCPTIAISRGHERAGASPGRSKM
jgi:hypothetical protein